MIYWVMRRASPTKETVFPEALAEGNTVTWVGDSRRITQYIIEWRFYPIFDIDNLF